LEECEQRVAEFQEDFAPSRVFKRYSRMCSRHTWLKEGRQCKLVS
jgi:hypothetical protein